MISRIAITGPESTGKSWLAENLAKTYLCKWVPEFARSYIESLNRPYNYNDILDIAKGQIASEDGLLRTADKYLFADTDCLVTKIWCDVKYGKCHDWIIQQLKQRPHDLYLLCDVDLPWEPDPLREHPHLRKYLFGLYFDELKLRNLPFEIISGTGNARFQCATEAINKRIHA